MLDVTTDSPSFTDCNAQSTAPDRLWASDQANAIFQLDGWVSPARYLSPTHIQNPLITHNSRTPTLTHTCANLSLVSILGAISGMLEMLVQSHILLNQVCGRLGV